VRLFLPAALLTVITGIGMVQVAHLSFGSTGIVWGLAGGVVSVLLGVVFTGGAARRLAIADLFSMFHVATFQHDGKALHRSVTFIQGGCSCLNRSG
ncbi:MAG: hypothetical protein ACT443_11980, partial [Gemmatimonadota bacterium]